MSDSGVSAICGTRFSCLRVLAVSVLFACSVFFVSVAHAQIRFSVDGLTINGQAPAVLQESDADQILNATVSYQVDLGYAGGHALYLQAEPLGSAPATLAPAAGTPRCAVSGQSPNVDVHLENPGWGSGGASTGYVAASYTSDEENALPFVTRSFTFTFGTLCQDSEIEPTEQFQVTLWFTNGGVESALLRYIVRIVDSGRGETGLAGELEVTETDADFVAFLALPLDQTSDRVRCYPYRIAYSRSTAGESDARLVGSDGRSPAGFGVLVAQPAATSAVSSNLLIVGDDLVEGDETLHLEVYAPGLPGAASCSPSGAPVFSIVVVIVDDDIPVGLASVVVDGADPEGNHPEGDPGDRFDVHLIVTFDRRLTESVLVRYGAVADGTARGAPPGQDVEVVPSGSVRVAPGEIQVRVRVATIIGDDRIEAVEYFRAWAAVDEASEAAKQWVTVSIANDDVPGDTLLNVVLEGEGIAGGEIVEGDPASGSGGGDCQGEWKCVFLILEFTSAERQFEDVVYEVHTVAGSARPGEDYRFPDGVQVRLEAGHLRTFDVDDPLMLRVRQDFFVERDREDLLLAVHMMQGGESPLFSWYQRIVIVDDDSPGGEDGSLWFGLAEDPDLLDAGLASCPDPMDRVIVAEPLGGGFRSVRLELAMADPDGAAAGSADGGCSPSGQEAWFRYELVSRSAEVGVDVIDPAGVGGDIRFVGGRATLELYVVGDVEFEGEQFFSLALLGSAGRVALFTVLVEDAEVAGELFSARTASAVRIGRVLASEVSDVLADRFSCAVSSACADPGAPAGEQLWPGGRSGPTYSPSVLLRRLAWSAGSLAMPAMAPALAPDGQVASFSQYGGAIPGGLGPAGMGMVGGAGAAGRLGPGSHAPQAAGVLQADRLAVVGRALDGLRYQGDPGRWLGPVNIARGDHRPRTWTFWARSSYGAVDDVSGTSRRLRTSMLSMTGGLDREVGRFRVGVLYTHAFAQSLTDVHGYAQEFVTTDSADGSTWRVVAPYVGWVPHRRFRFWVSPGWVAGGGEVAAPGEGLDSTMRMVVSGASLSVYSSREVSVDLEADVFEVDVDRTPSLSERLLELRDDAFSGRAQRARLAGRVGVPLGDPELAASRLSVRFGRRWDVGTDIDWLWGPGVRPASWHGAGQVSATDLLVDLRYRRLRSSVSLVLTLGVQLGGEQPLVDGEDLRFSSRRQVGLGGGVVWGAAGSRAGWSASLRPSYGHVSAAMPGWWNGAVPRIGGVGGFDIAPMVDAEAGYGFEDGGRVSVSGRRGFGGGRSGAGGLGAVFRYGRGW